MTDAEKEKARKMESLLRQYRMAIPHEHFMGQLCSICEETDKTIGEAK